MFSILITLVVGSALSVAERPSLHVLLRTTAASALATQATGSSNPTVSSGDADVPNYVIGPDDVLSVVFWREKDLSSDVTVRADGKISLPLLNDIQAAGLTPLQLRAALEKAAAQFVEDPVATVVVKQINSRKVFVTGMVQKPGAYPLTGPMTTLQLLATAGGFKDFAGTKDIVVVRTERGVSRFIKFNYQDVAGRKRGAQDVGLEPGDTVIVP